MTDRPIRVLELRSVRGTGGGPEKTILTGAALTDPARIAVTVCYIRDDRDSVFGIDQTASRLPIDYVEIREKHSLDPGAFRQLRQLVRERAIDIVHAHEYKTDLFAWLLARTEPVRPLATAHGWTGNSRRERLLYYPADKWLLARFPHVVAVSSEIRQQLLRYGARPERVVTILNGIDPERFRRDPARVASARRALGIGDDQFVVGSVGRLERQKRFDLLIDEFAALHRERPHLRLIIAGDGSLREALQQQIARLGLVSACRLLGHRADVIELHHAMDLFVQSSDYEGTPNAVLEAMALETPIVATDVGGTAELVRHGADGLIVAPGNAGVLTDAVGAAIGDLHGRRARVAAARRRVTESLSFEARQARLNELYLRMMDAPARPGAHALVQA
jgi:glycosyltransferase involved in cell wall biosynthesis